MKKLQWGLALVMSAVLAAPVSAALLAYEGFDYATGHDFESDTGTDGGIGWANNWTRNGGSGGVGKLTVQSAGLKYVDGNGTFLKTKGGYALADHNGIANSDELATGTGNVQYFRKVDLSSTSATTLNQLVGVDGSFYISFIGQRRGATDLQAFPLVPDDTNPYSRNAHVSLSSGGTLGENAQIGNFSEPTNDWSLRAKNSNLNDVNTGVPFTSQQFVVLKITAGLLNAMDSNAHPDHIDMWLNPLLTSEMLAGTPDGSKDVLDNDTNLFNLAMNGIAMLVGNQSSNRAGAVMAFDEFRIGTTWESVTPTVVPEPGSMVLAAVGGIALLGLARARRAA